MVWQFDRNGVAVRLCSCARKKRLFSRFFLFRQTVSLTSLHKKYSSELQIRWNIFYNVYWVSVLVERHSVHLHSHLFADICKNCFMFVLAIL